MADRKKNFDDDALRRHLEQQREQEQNGDKSSPSLVSLVEGDSNTVFKPITFFSIIGTIIIAIVTSVTQVVNFNNSFQEMEENIRSNTASVSDISEQINIVKRDLRTQIINSNDANTNLVDELVERLTDLEDKVNNELRFTTSSIENRTIQINEDIVELKDNIRDVNARIRAEELDIKEVESQLRILEIRYEQLSKE